MVGTALKVLAYKKAPRTTFMLRHPVKAARLRKARWDMRHAYAPRMAAVGAALVALPLGLWLGKRNGRHASES
jgi:hypothetical protein